MTENIFSPRTNAQTQPETEPTLRRNIEVPKGVLQKNLKTCVYLAVLRNRIARAQECTALYAALLPAP